MSDAAANSRLMPFLNLKFTNQKPAFVYGITLSVFNRSTSSPTSRFISIFTW